MIMLFAELLRQHRDRFRKSRAKFAKMLGVSASYLYYLETGKRKPSRDLTSTITRVLQLTEAESAELLVSAGHELSSEPTLLRTTKAIREALESPGLSSEECEELAHHVLETVIRWRRLRATRDRPVSKALMVAAGWQARLLAPARLGETLTHAAQEVAKAGIKELIVVIPPEAPDFAFEDMKRLGLTVKPVVQTRPLGLGNAVLVAREHIRDDMFALILPDDIDPSRTCLSEMVRLYRKVRTPIVAVSAESIGHPRPEVRYYGIALLTGPIKGCLRLHHVGEVQEKPQDLAKLPAEARVILGRYILGPDIFDVLQALDPDRHTGRYELTDALASLVCERRLCAYEPRHSLLPVAPVMFLIEKLVASIGNRTTLERIVQLIQNLSEDIDRL
jgi:UTP-glucose-1-phosphate uridylyltransferase/transcriptional regulator with XRE-family HTH domain